MRIGILYICTGPYKVFWPEFYASCEDFFFTEEEKEYFVFTDGKLAENVPGHVHQIEQQQLGWPYDTLLRFQIFASLGEQLRGFDLLFFCNANIEFLRPMGKEILPKTVDELIVVQHPGYIKANVNDFPYERNPLSLAYIPKGRGEVYVCGGFNGGFASTYIHLIQTVEKNIETDLQRNITASWHDESHINRYILDHPFHLLSASYCYPEYEDLPLEKNVRIRDKIRYGGHTTLRRQNVSLSVMAKERSKYVLARLGLLPHVQALFRALRSKS